MIEVKRTPKPEILKRNEKPWSKAIKSAKTPEDLENAISKYRHPKIKDALEEMFHGKCAYCESYILNVDYGDIEHHKPKSIFPELAVNWKNLFLSCKKCNGSGQKGDLWPNVEEGGPLINPCNESPKDFFDFEFDELTRVTIVKPRNERGETSERIYGLNKITLLKDRNNYVKKLVALATYYHTDTRAKEILDEAIRADAEYTAFAIMVKEKYT